MEMALDESWGLSFKEQTCILVFLNHCFNSLEVDLVRNQVQKLVSLPIWVCLPEVCKISSKLSSSRLIRLLHLFRDGESKN